MPDHSPAPLTPEDLREILGGVVVRVLTPLEKRLASELCSALEANERQKKELAESKETARFCAVALRNANVTWTDEIKSLRAELNAATGAEWCDGCEARATGHDADDVPLCAECLADLKRSDTAQEAREG